MKKEEKVQKTGWDDELIIFIDEDTLLEEEKDLKYATEVCYYYPPGWGGKS